MSLSRTAIALVLSGILAGPAVAQEVKSGGESFVPNVGQAGKDVIWVPTPAGLVTSMLNMAKTTPQDFVIDLGSGDGRIAIAAAKEFGANAMGVEYNPDMVQLSQRNAQQAGVADKVKFVQGDIFATDFSRATVVTMYLLPTLNQRLRPTVLNMRPGTRVTSHAFTMGDWEADETSTVENRTAYLWIVPAKVEGRWTFQQQGGGTKFDVDLTQTYQKVSGAIASNNGARMSVSGKLRGETISLSFTDDKAGEQSLTGQVQDGRINATLRAPDGTVQQLVGTRR